MPVTPPDSLVRGCQAVTKLSCNFHIAIFKNWNFAKNMPHAQYLGFLIIALYFHHPPFQVILPKGFLCIVTIKCSIL